MTVRAKVILRGVQTSMYKQYDYDYSKVSPSSPHPRVIGNRDVLMQNFEFDFVSGNQDPNHENTKFWQYSPSGKLTLGSINPEVAKYFEIGKEYYLDISEANEEHK